MIVFPNAKINLGLNILNKRPDGFHNLQSIFLPVNIKDALEVIIDKNTDDFEFFNSGLKIDAEPHKNLVVNAYKLLKNEYKLPPVKIYLLKNIPFGAGLGGGSADASFMLKLLNELFELKISVSGLKEYAAKLGSDCAFFVENIPAIASGKGEILNPIKIDFSDYKIYVIKPNININTANIYSFITPNSDVEDLKITVKNPVEKWKSMITNDFEKIVFHRNPEIEEIKNYLYKKGAVYSSMSGSGSAVYGIFDKNFNLKLNIKNSHIFDCKII